MAIGFVLISTSPGKEKDVLRELRKIEEVRDLHPLFGAFDIMAKIESEDYDIIGRIVIEKIRTIDDVTKTQTMGSVSF